MFTGIVEELGTVVAFEARDAGAQLTVACGRTILDDVSLGASIAVNGACLSASRLREGEFSADLAPETLQRTNLGQLRAGSLVNLERPLRASGRLDGHFVLGHIDGTATLLSLSDLGGDNWWLTLQVPRELTRYIVSKGSLAVDGISLTVAEVNDDVLGFTVIPLTYEHTTLRRYTAGSLINIEVDILAKHLEKLTGRA